MNIKYKQFIYISSHFTESLPRGYGVPVMADGRDNSFTHSVLYYLIMNMKPSILKSDKRWLEGG